MIRILTIIFFFILVISAAGQVRNDADKLYYDNSGMLFSGISYEYYPDSVIYSEISIEEGELDGLTKIYFHNRQLEEIRSFKKGMMHGKWESWNRQNIKTAEANYTDNKKDGKWFVWDDKGTLRYNMTYKAGIKTGTWKMYDEKGKLTGKKKY